MSTPSIAPPQRDPADVAPTDSYHKADPVWVYRDGWRAGVIEAASARAVTVTYRPGPHRGTGVDTFTAPYVTPRADEDPALDRRSGGPLMMRRPRTGGDGAMAMGGDGVIATSGNGVIAMGGNGVIAMGGLAS